MAPIIVSATTGPTGPSRSFFSGTSADCIAGTTPRRLRGIYEEIKGLGAEVIAIGTGNARYARAFVEEEEIPFPVLVDDDAEAAHSASVKRGSAFQVLGLATYGGSIRAWRAGHKVHKPGKRTFQLGATFVVGPGDVVTYEHLDSNTTDHAPLDEVLGALRWASR